MTFFKNVGFLMMSALVLFVCGLFVIAVAMVMSVAPYIPIGLLGLTLVVFNDKD